MAQNEKGGADLDIFEDLGKKAAPARAPSGRSVPPPPPPSMRAPALEVGKRTLLGVTAPAAMPMAPSPGPSPSGALPAAPTTGTFPPGAVPTAPATGTFPPPSSPAIAAPPAPFPPAPPSPSRLPPPPPGRASLPPVVAPPPAKIPTPPPPPIRAANSVDVDWDDDDEATQVFAEEATHIFNEDATHVLEGEKSRALASAPMPAAGVPAALPSRPKATLLGLTAPQALPAPSRPPPRTTPPPPPARTSGFPGPTGFSFPPTINPGGPPPSSTQRGLGNAPWSSLPPPPALPAIPGATPTIPRHSSAPEYAPARNNMEATALLSPRVSPVGMRIIVGAAIGLAALTLVLVFLPKSKGSVLVNVADQRGAPVNRLDVFVDGKKSPECGTAPCTVPELSTGAHEIKVLAEGFDVPAVQAVVVESGKPTPVNFVVGSSRGTGIKVSGVQAGVKLYVDDKEIGPLPQDVHDLSAGDHVIRVAGSERYQALEKHVTVDRDRVEDLGTITLKVLKGKVTVAPGTSGARVYIVSGSDRRELPMLPISVDIDTMKSWSLEASKPGYEDYRQLISFDDGQAEKAYTVTLEPRSVGGAIPMSPAPVMNYSSPSPAPAPRPSPVAAAPAAEGGEAFLNINSIPPSTCFLDGRSLGSTPRVHVSVKPGAHTVKFVDSDDGLSKTISVSVGAGETKPAVSKLN
jgi:hypothetical protein